MRFETMLDMPSEVMFSSLVKLGFITAEKINFSGWGISGRLYGGSVATYMEDQWPFIWRIIGLLYGGSAATYLWISGRLSGLTGIKTKPASWGFC
jgi:hypothetical protein